MPTINGTEGTDILSGGNEDDLISGFGGNDQLTGNGGNDTIDGGLGDDIITGSGGNDILTGGAGVDAFRDTMAGLNGDRITDFLPGDRIQIMDLNIQNANITITGSTITFNGNSITVDNLGPGRVIVREIIGGGVELRLQGVARNDFNGDGRSDILWRHDSGVTVDWLSTANGGMVDNSANLWSNPGTEWQVAGIGDFNGDGRDDILWRHDSGVTVDWLSTANGGMVDNSANLWSNPGTEWQVAGIGDFNGDGRDDILWRHDSGVTVDWLSTANGGMVDNSANLWSNPGTEWQVAGIGDFNGDGRDDILWRHDSGVTVDWLSTANGGMVDNSANLWSNPGTEWQVAGIGDFNGDGRDDILWRHDSGVTVDWLSTANGGMVDNSANLWSNPGTEWQVAGIGDFNGDGRDDILWRHDSGVTVDWLSTANGGMVDNSANLWSNPGTEWHVQPDVLI